MSSINPYIDYFFDSTSMAIMYACTSKSEVRRDSSPGNKCL